MDPTVTPESPPPQEATADQHSNGTDPVSREKHVRRQLRDLAKKTARDVGPASVALRLVTLQIEAAIFQAYAMGCSDSQEVP